MIQNAHVSCAIGSRRSSSARLALLAALAFSLAACGGSEQPAPATPAAPAQTPAPAAGQPVPAAVPAVPKLPVDELLKNARAALTADRLVTPPGDNAIEYYLEVLAQEPNNPQATQALVDVFPLAAGMAERAIAQRQVDEAERIVGLLDRADPKSYTVATLRNKLGAAQAVQQRELAVQQQREAQQQAAAAAAAAAAQQAAAPPPEPVTPPPAATPPPTPQPQPQPAAPVAATPPPPPAPVGETRDALPLRQVPPEYPVDAARKRQEGWVELEFTVGVDGRVTDVSVARAQPSRVFDREAVRAIQQWTFEPALRDGRPVSSPVRRRIEFKL